MTTGIRKTGDFCWINMLTAEPAHARDYFGKLLGWTYSELPDVGHSILVDGKRVGGLFDLNGPNTPPGTVTTIGVMVKVDSADASAEKFKALGGTALPAFDIGPQGRMAVSHDPNGANIDVWEAKAMAGMDADNYQHGVPSWFETMTTDVEVAKKFYTSVFGWTAKTQPMGDFEYTEFQLDGAPVAGMLQLTPDMGEMKSRWSVYFTVNDVDATVATSTSLGGGVIVPAKDIPTVGRFAGLTSPQGVDFFIIKYAAQ